MKPSMADGAILGLGAVIGATVSAYNTLLHAPAVVAARPELADLGFWTALFSGRFLVWLFYNHAVPASAATILFWTVFAGAALWAKK